MKKPTHRELRVVREALTEKLKQTNKPVVTLYRLSVLADEAAGRELFDSLDEYRVLFNGFRIDWFNGILQVINPYSTERVPGKDVNPTNHLTDAEYFGGWF